MSWGSWLSGADASNAALTSNFHSVVSDHDQSQLFGELQPKDLEWTCAGGFTTETQTWYSILKDGTFATSQIIHSSVGLWYPQIQITFKHFNPKTKERVWKSVNVTHWACPSPSSNGDKRSIKSDQFDIKFLTNSDGSETYQIDANMDTDLQLSWSFTRPASSKGWKLGKGPQGGMSYFGTKKDSPDGYVVHRFWPQTLSKGHIISKGKAIDAEGLGMFVHAIQGMRPNLVASKWNFANFQSENLGGVVGIQMEFTTINDYGLPPSKEKLAAAKEGEQPKREVVTVNIGSITVGGKLISVTGSTRSGNSGEGLQGSQSTVKHLNKVLDPQTSYKPPQNIEFIWQGQSLDESGKGQGNDSLVNAKLNVDLGKPYPEDQARGLVEKVDVLAEIPYVIKKFVNYVAGTKPYIYQTINPATLELSLPESVKVEGAEGSDLKVDGTLYEEHTFISE